MICTCGYGRPGETCLGNRQDCIAKEPCAGGAWILGEADFRSQGGAAHGVCSVCKKEPRAHPDKQFEIRWIDNGREPQCAPDPNFPEGKDIDMSDALQPGWPTCRTELPYPAKRCGLYVVTCRHCDLSVAITTAGRPDDPRSARVGCLQKAKGAIH